MNCNNEFDLDDRRITSTSQTNNVEENPEIPDDIFILSPDEFQDLTSDPFIFQLLNEFEIEDPVSSTSSNLINTTNINNDSNSPKNHFVYNNKFIKYKRGKNNNAEKVYFCAICSKEFDHQYTLIRHLPTHTDERKFKCEICSKAFRQITTLYQHRVTHSKEKSFVCEEIFCRKSFSRMSSLNSHRKTHSEIKTHQCIHCGKGFHQKGNLRNHIFTHTNERPFKCDLCNRGFNQMSNLMVHKSKIHQTRQKSTFTCKFCQAEFGKLTGLKNHEQMEHRNMIENMESDPVPQTLRATTGILVNRIKTEEMNIALANKQTPFALLKLIDAFPVLVKILSVNDKKQMLITVSSDDLLKHGEVLKDQEGKDMEDKNRRENNGNGNSKQLKIPIVAMIQQFKNMDGNEEFLIQRPNPNPTDEMSINCNFDGTYKTMNEIEGEFSFKKNSASIFFSLDNSNK